MTIAIKLVTDTIKEVGGANIIINTNTLLGDARVGPVI